MVHELAIVSCWQVARARPAGHGNAMAGTNHGRLGIAYYVTPAGKLPFAQPVDFPVIQPARCSSTRLH